MKPLQALTQSETIELLDLIHDCVCCSSMHDFLLVVERFRKILNFDNLIYCHLLKQGGNFIPDRVVNISFPDDWITIYANKRYWEVDPIIRQTETCLGVQYWDDTYKRHLPRKEFVSMAEDFGLVKGYTVTNPQRSLVDQNMISFAGSNLESCERNKIILERIAPHIGYSLEVAENIRTYAAVLPPGAKPLLTNREIEVLEWIKDGKTSWEISVILNISERTVNFHTGNVKEKLNAVSRVQAVAAAIQQGLIGF